MSHAPLQPPPAFLPVHGRRSEGESTTRISTRSGNTSPRRARSSRAGSPAPRRATSAGLRGPSSGRAISPFFPTATRIAPERVPAPTKRRRTRCVPSPDLRDAGAGARRHRVRGVLRALPHPVPVQLRERRPCSGSRPCATGRSKGRWCCSARWCWGGAFMFAAIETVRPAAFLALLSWAPVWAVAAVLRHTPIPGSGPGRGGAHRSRGGRRRAPSCRRSRRLVDERPARVLLLALRLRRLGRVHRPDRSAHDRHRGRGRLARARGDRDARAMVSRGARPTRRLRRRVPWVAPAAGLRLRRSGARSGLPGSPRAPRPPRLRVADDSARTVRLAGDRACPLPGQAP